MSKEEEIKRAVKELGTATVTDIRRELSYRYDPVEIANIIKHNIDEIEIVERRKNPSCQNRYGIEE